MPKIENLIEKLAEELYEIDRKTPGRDDGPFKNFSYTKFLKYKCDAERTLKAIRKVIDAEKKKTADIS